MSTRRRMTFIPISLTVVVSLAVAHFAQADPPATKLNLTRQADAEFQQGRALYAQKNYAAAISHFQAAAQKFDVARQPLAAAFMVGWQGNGHRESGNDKQAVTAYRASVERFAKLGKDGLEGLAMNSGSLGQLLKRLERFDEAAVALDRAAKAAVTLFGADHYRSIDARLAAADVRRWARLTPEQRRQLDQAEELAGTLFAHMQSRQFESALVSTTRASEIIKAVLGEKHLLYAQSLANMAMLHRVMGNYDRAATHIHKANEIFRSVLGENHPLYATGLHFLATLYTEMGENDRALPLCKQTLEIRKAVLGERHHDYVASRIILAELYRDMGDYDRALPIAEEAPEILKAIVGEHHPEYATSLNNLALLYEDLGEYDRAMSIVQRVLEIRRVVPGENHPDYAISLDSLAGLYGDMGRFNRALPLARRALDIRRTVFGENRPEYARSLSRLGLLYNCIGDFVRAESLLGKAPEIFKSALGENHPEYASSLNNLAALYIDMDRYDLALPRMQQACEIWKTLGKDHPEYGAGLNNLASVYQDMGHRARAVQLMQQASEIFRTLGERHPKYAATISNLAVVYAEAGDFRRAVPLAKRALTIRKAVLSNEHPDYPLSLNNLAGLYEALGQYSEAEPLMRQAIEATTAFLERSAVGLTERQQLAHGQMLRYQLDSYLSLLTRMDGKDEAAFHSVLAWKGSTLVRQRTMRLLADQPEIEPLFRRLQSVTRRWAHLAMATPPVEKTRATRFHEQLTALQVEKEKLEADLSRQSALFRGAKTQITLHTLLASLPKETVLVDFFQYSHRRWIDLPQEGDIGARLKQTDKGITVSTLISDASPAERDRLRVGDRIVAVADSQGKWIRTQGQELASVVALITGNVGTQVHLRIQRDDQTQPQETSLTRIALPYQKTGAWKFTPSLTAFVVRLGRPVRRFELGPIAPIREAIYTWRTSFGQTPPAQRAGRLLREKLWQPLLPALTDAQTILVSPDGVLGRLPLAALPGNKPGTYLLEDHRLAIVPVPQLIPALMATGNRKKLDKELLLLGGVDYDAQLDDPLSDNQRPHEHRTSDKQDRDNQWVLRAVRGDVTWKPLKGTATEVDFIRDLYTRLHHSDGRVIVDLRGRHASEDAFRRAAPQCMLLHIATHGFFATADRHSALSAEMVAQAERSVRDSPFGLRRRQVYGYSRGLLSGLIFAGANHPPQLPADPTQWSRDLPDDGIISSDEVAFLPLEGARLAVLSACETGLGEVAGGEGLLGLQRGFQVSGARSTVATLWKVSDAATRRIMEEFYTNYLDKKMSTLDALRTAQLWALHHPREVSRGLPGPRDVPRGLDIPTDKTQVTRTSPYYWATFVLSGDWR